MGKRRKSKRNSGQWENLRMKTMEERTSYVLHCPETVVMEPAPKSELTELVERVLLYRGSAFKTIGHKAYGGFIYAGASDAEWVPNVGTVVLTQKNELAQLVKGGSYEWQWYFPDMSETDEGTHTTYRLGQDSYPLRIVAEPSKSMSRSDFYYWRDMGGIRVTKDGTTTAVPAAPKKRDELDDFLDRAVQSLRDIDESDTPVSLMEGVL